MQVIKTWRHQIVENSFGDVVKQTAPKNKLIDILRSAPISLDNLELPERKIEILRENLI